jgi:apolipoprotein N-acyltransferase
LGVEGVLDARLPQPVPVPLYARIGDSPVFAGLALVLGLAYLRRRTSSLLHRVER